MSYVSVYMSTCKSVIFKVFIPLWMSWLVLIVFPCDLWPGWGVTSVSKVNQSVDQGLLWDSRVENWHTVWFRGLEDHKVVCCSGGLIGRKEDLKEDSWRGWLSEWKLHPPIRMWIGLATTANLEALHWFRPGDGALSSSFYYPLRMN